MVLLVSVPLFETAADSLVGKTIDGRYTVLRRLGSGGMATVYAARQHKLESEVALKVMKPESLAYPGAKKRFCREAMAASALNHPNTVTIHDFGVDPSGLMYMVTELLHGRTLRAAMSGGVMEATRAVDIAVQISRSLADAHAHGVVHRDIKPANIYLVPEACGTERVKVLDFGLARLRDRPHLERLTLPGFVAGTPAYLSPEASQGKEVSFAADIYGLGIILFQLLTGAVPYHADSAAEIMQMHVSSPIPSFEERAYGLDTHAPLEGLIPRFLAKDPRYRFESAVDVITALNGVRPDRRRGNRRQTVSGRQSVSRRQKNPAPIVRPCFTPTRLEMQATQHEPPVTADAPQVTRIGVPRAPLPTIRRRRRADTVPGRRITPVTPSAKVVVGRGSDTDRRSRTAVVASHRLISPGQVDNKPRSRDTYVIERPVAPAGRPAWFWPAAGACTLLCGVVLGWLLTLMMS